MIMNLNMQNFQQNKFKKIKKHNKPKLKIYYLKDKTVINGFLRYDKESDTEESVNTIEDVIASI